MKELDEPNKGGEYMKKTLSTALIATLFITGMAAHMAETCVQEHGNEVGITGDINMDGEVNQLDLSLLGKAWNSRLGDPHYNACADLNNDRVIDLKDLSLLGQNWGKKGFRTYAVPTPFDSCYQNPNNPICGYSVELEGIWIINEKDGLVTLNCQKVGAWMPNFSPFCKDRIEILSSGDSVLDVIKYKDNLWQWTIVERGPTYVCWKIKSFGKTHESWYVVIKDNGNRRIRLKLTSYIKCEGCTYSSEAIQIIEIKW